MKINPINSNNQPQNRQQAFGAIAGKDFKTVLHSMFTACNGPESRKSLAVLNSEEIVSAFAQSFDEVRVRPLYFDINPIVNLKDNRNGSYTLGVDTLGAMSKNVTLSEKTLKTSSNVLATIMYWSQHLANELTTALTNPIFEKQLEKATRKSEHHVINDAYPTGFTSSLNVHDGLQNLMRFLRHEAPDEQVRPWIGAGAYED